MEVAPRSDPLAANLASLKRKRDEDDDVDLYGESETTDKRPRGEPQKETPQSGNHIEFVAKEENKPEEFVWLIFLISQEGHLEVYPPPEFSDDRFAD
jgi:hypothetical protein